ncbi:MAG: glycosyltransferase [Bacteroidales bacterium]|nr:glycosyltransferase [Bacteroidales bacterium]
MRIALLHTNPYYQEIEDLILDIVSHPKNKDLQFFEFHSADFKWFRIRRLFQLRSFLKKNNIDIIHTYHYHEAFYALMAAKGLGIKVVYSSYFYHDDLKACYKWMFEYVLKNVDSIIFQSDVHKDRVIAQYKLNPERHFKLYHGFSPYRFDNFCYNSLRDELFIDDFKFVIGSHGDFTPEHGLMNIMKMIKKLRKTGRNFVCLLSGEQNDENDAYFNDCKYYYLLQGLDNYINFIGRRYDIANYMSQLDVFLYHSDNETVALPVMQALIAGANVVANDNEMIREICSGGKYATLYKSDDIDDFAEKTRMVLNDIEEFQLIAETVQEECRIIFGIDRHIAGLIDVYSKVNKY